MTKEEAKILFKVAAVMLVIGIFAGVSRAGK
jgi:uncharacterized membrane protein YtjA (UPF0391 family)